MPFGLINILSSYQEIIDEILQEIKKEVHYLNNILIHIFGTEEEYQASVELVLERYMDYILTVNLSKLDFHVQETVLLGYVINGSKVKIDGTKIKTMKEWAIRHKKKELEAFLSFMNYY